MKNNNKKISKNNTIKKIWNEKLETFNKNTFKTTEVIFLIVLTACISLMMGYLININDINQSVENDDNLQEIVDNYNYIVDNYYTNVDKNKIVSGAIKGMVNSLGDDYSSLLEQGNSSTFYTSLNGSYEGIGVQIYNDENNNIVVLAVIENSPSKKAGIKTGDIIKQIDDKKLSNTNIDELTKYIKNSKKTEHTVIINRDGIEQSLTVEKSLVTIKSVASKIIEKENKKIGYIYISIFSNSTVQQFETALNDLEKQKIDSLIIDVRENSGGHLKTAAEILSLLVDSSNVIYQTEKDGKKTKYYSTGKENKNYPIVILQNNRSASASELLSSALKELHDAIIIGEKSYGKGTIQEVVYLKNGDTYKFTTKKWLTPNGNWINEIGVKPDIEVILSDIYYENPIDDNDNQLQEAIKYLLNKGAD